MFGGLNTTHLIILLVIVMLIMGPKNLPALGKSLGQAVKDFKSGLHGVDEELEANEKAKAAEAAKAAEPAASAAAAEPPKPAAQEKTD